ncbi:MAG: efflux RND transporter periplasmic adaptor subunit, partial [Sphingomonadales bacterium]
EQVTLAAPVTERITRLNFDDGAFVQRGQVIAILAAGQENAQLAEAGARSREARQQLARLEQLKARGFATNSAVDTQTALAGQASAQAAQARASIGDRVIRAPFSGWVSLRNISAGAVVSAGTEIAQISDVSKIKLDFAVPETLLSQIKPGQTIAARAAAYPDQPFRGTIATIDAVLNAETRAATVRAILPNGDRKLKPGMLLSVSIESAERTSLAVPELAVVEEGDESFVYLLEGEKVKRTPVKPGLRQGGMVEILAGLTPGQRIVTEGVVKISNGQTVRLAGAPAAKPQAK